MLTYLKESLKSRSGVHRLLWILLLLFVFSISFSIAASHILLTATAAVYLIWKFRNDRRFPRVPILMPALAIVYTTFLSVIFSIHPSISYFDAKNIALFIIIPIVYDAVRDLEDVHVIYGVLILTGVISAAFGLYQFFGSEADLVNSRITGFMGHWMTFSGLLMILNVVLFSQLLFARTHPGWFYPAFALLSLTLLFSLTRSAWLGFLAAATALIAMRNARWVVAVPVVVLMIFVASVLVFPSAVANRISSIFNPNETSNRDRLQMIRSGWDIIRDYPLTGVGNDMIKRVYPHYRAPDSVFRNNQHLHNNLMQLAAENGILALAAWMWLVLKIVLDLI
ncbi:MAG TPA: O-antigen ligase family protein, partial [Acidobacteriota bacterium]|nr:O-antigen ligase family protein [Acidobacteriota bacterium]